MSIEKYMISRDDSVYEAWPDLVLTASGKLICIFSECVHHKDRSKTRIVMKESTDRGRSWGEKIYLTEQTTGTYYWNCGRISRLSYNRLVIVCDKVYGGGESKAVNYLWFSDSDGQSWEGPFETPATGIVPDKLLELKSGRWILSAHEKSPVHGFLEQKLWYSDNKGETWSDPIIVASQEGLKLCEVSILQIPDGTLVAFLRENSAIGLDCYKAISYDEGETWEGLYTVPLPGCHRPVSGFLNSGMIMITYRFTQGEKRHPKYLLDFVNFFAALTDVDSVKMRERKEQWTRIMPIDYDRSKYPDCGYSGWVQFEDGEIYIAQYIVDDAPNAQIRGYSFREEDIMLD